VSLGVRVEVESAETEVCAVELVVGVGVGKRRRAFRCETGEESSLLWSMEVEVE